MQCPEREKVLLLYLSYARVFNSIYFSAAEQSTLQKLRFLYLLTSDHFNSFFALRNARGEISRANKKLFYDLLARCFQSRSRAFSSNAWNTPGPIISRVRIGSPGRAGNERCCESFFRDKKKEGGRNKQEEKSLSFSPRVSRLIERRPVACPACPSTRYAWAFTRRDVDGNSASEIPRGVFTLQ